jgi:flagellar L-ring protein precursor FlgH
MATWMFLLTLIAPDAEARKRDPAAADPPPPIPPVVYQPDLAATNQPGSLWNEVRARQLMGMDGNARQVGDLITVEIFETMDTSLDAQTSTNRRSSVDGEISAAFGAVQKLLGDNDDIDALALATALSTGFEGSGRTRRGSAVQATLTCEVIEVLPNGNLRIWGFETLRLNREKQYLVLEGIIRPRDVQMDNTIQSDLIARPILEVTGSGVVADKQGPGWLARLLDAIWPF